jgi:hypothetical protein
LRTAGFPEFAEKSNLSGGPLATSFTGSTQAAAGTVNSVSAPNAAYVDSPSRKVAPSRTERQSKAKWKDLALAVDIELICGTPEIYQGPIQRYVWHRT